MLPPHNIDKFNPSGGFSTARTGVGLSSGSLLAPSGGLLPPAGLSASLLIHRLLDPIRLVDWHEALISFEYAIFRPSKLAKQSVQRHHIINQLSRDDPGIILLFFLMILLTSPLYYLVLRGGGGGGLVKHFLFYPVCWSFGIAIVISILIYFGIFCFLKAGSKNQILKFSSQAYDLGVKIVSLKNPKFKNSDHLPNLLQANLNDSHKIYLDYDLFLHCLDLSLNTLIPYLFILGPTQFPLIPFCLPKHQSDVDGEIAGLATSGGFANFARCFFSNGIHASAALAGFYALSCNLKLLPQPANLLAGLAFAGAAVSFAVISVLTIAQVNLNEIFFELFYGL